MTADDAVPSYVEVTNDQLFKQLLQTFLPQFLSLFYPDVASRLDFSDITFLDKETFTDLPQGARREADVVARVATQDGEPKLIIINVEIESKRNSEFPARLCQYYHLLRYRYGLPVLPLVVYLAPGAGGVVSEIYEETVLDEEVLRFRYRAIGLPDLSAFDYQRRSEPLALALSAVMRSRSPKQAQRRATLFQRIVTAPANDAERYLLLTVVDRFLRLNTVQQVEFEQIISTPPYKEAAMLMTSWHIAGYKDGRQEGRQEGRHEAKRETLERLAHRYFGALPVNVAARIAAASEAELDAALERLPDASSADALFPA